MIEKIDPIELKLLILQKPQLTQLAKITTLDVFTPSTEDFHPDGLFSAEIFGPIGSLTRNETFAVIDLGVEVLHPLVYTYITSLGSKYADILSGKKYFSWDDKINDFVDSDLTIGGTGYEFFMRHVNDIKFTKNQSMSRNNKIDVINKYKNSTGITLNSFLVLPAGLRDFTVDRDGVSSEDEINVLYRRLLSLSTLLSVTNISSDDLSLIDPTRTKLQLAVGAIYDYILTLLDGKKKFIVAKWTKRGVVNGTRNVITSLPAKIPDLDKIENSLGLNQSAVGIFQYVNAIKPIAKFHVREKILRHVFNEDTTSAYLINKKSLVRELVEIDEVIRERWYSDEGLDSIISKLDQQGMGQTEILIKDHYIGMIYIDKKYIKLILDPDTLPDGFSKKNLRPITYGELFYFSLTDIKDKYPGVTSRYPVTGEGSIYPIKPYLKTTIKGISRIVLNDDFTPSDVVLSETPDRKSVYYNGMSVHYTKLVRLGADHDGDTMGLIILYTDESIEEIENLFKQRKFYVDATGQITHSTNNEVVAYVVKTLNQTKDKK